MGKGKTTRVKRRNEAAAAWTAAYKDTRPLQGKLDRNTRCVVCREWTAAADYNPARCGQCTGAGRLV